MANYNVNREEKDALFRIVFGSEHPENALSLYNAININAGHNDELLQKCKPMSDYSELIHRLRSNLRDGKAKEDVVAQTIDSCIEDGILSDILRKERARVMSTLVIGLTEEQKERMYAYEKECEREEGRAEGRAEGRVEGRKESDRLTEYLLAQDRIDDLKRTLKDEDFRNKILSEIND